MLRIPMPLWSYERHAMIMSCISPAVVVWSPVMIILCMRPYLVVCSPVMIILCMRPAHSLALEPVPGMGAHGGSGPADRVLGSNGAGDTAPGAGDTGGRGWPTVPR